MEDMKRTNVRLPQSLHFSLKSAALRRGTSIEEIIRTAILRELNEGPQLGGLAPDASYEGLLELQQQLEYCSKLVEKCLAPQSPSSRTFLHSIAARFLASLPAAVVITDASGSIAWQNSASVTIFGSHITGHSFGDLDANVDGPDWREEELATAGYERKTPFRVIHFPFRSSEQDELLAYGRVMIPAAQYELATACPQLMPVCDPESLAKAIAGIPEQFASSFLEHFPTTVTVKDLQRNLRWYNETYQRLSGARTSDVGIGLKTEELISLPDRAVQEHEELVLSQRLGVLAKETIGSQIRRNLRFPILDDKGSIMYLGAISTQPSPVAVESEISLSQAPEEQTKLK